MSLSGASEGGSRGSGEYGLIIEVMVIDMNESRVGTLEQVRGFVDGTDAVQFEPLGNDQTVHAVSAFALQILEGRCVTSHWHGGLSRFQR